ncbi:ATPase [Desulfosporosinus sp. HMP52]|uniref:heavy metal translocating P-type ATPase n=1 Tax=Desulfosporosinus sp. HMP52 TaxID=1487923 RepID=UPI00051FCDED|nr:heavy metal translocating P-type ATPase [Desulfosporosinus sp. HMP52]KGK89165.1 ATPase [Desulfosporosinus sp. HMP52]
MAKKELILEGLNCANCATKIEEQVKKVEGVSGASLNFVTKILTINMDSSGKQEDVLNQANQIINKLEPDVIIKDKALSRKEKKVLLLIGLDCANCATKIEKAINSLDGVSSATVDFVSRKLTIEVDQKRDLPRVVEQASKIAVQIESGIKVVENQDKKEESKEDEDGGIKKSKAIQLGIGAALFFVAILVELPFWAEFSIFLVSYVLVGGEVVLKAVRNISRGQVFDENFLMTVATIGAFAIKEFPEGVAVMLFYQVGELFQNMAVNRSRKSISALMDIRPDYANLKVGEDIKRVSPEEISVGDIIVIKPGEKVPLDGKVIEGMSMLDTSAITGESVPREVEPGNEILSGTINKNGLLTVEVTKEFGDSTVSKILDLVQNANSRKAPTEQFITKFSRYYTPVVVFVALAMAVVPPLVVSGATFSDWIYRALVFLVVSCPCALVISIPLGFFGGIGGAAKSGILVKGSNYLEALNNVDTIVFDKTGTLTKGVFKVTKISTQGHESEENLLEYAAFAESYSNHPIAISILKAYGKEINKSEIENYDEISGHGIKVSVKGKRILAGNKKLMAKENITYDEVDEIGTVVQVAIDGKYAGYIVISDEIKDDAKKATKELKAIGVRKLVMLTGDNKLVGEAIGHQLGLDEVHAELLPDQKVEKLELLEKQKKTKGKLLFVGDGINDAPVLARADVGVAMGGLGSDAAIEAADIVIMTDEPSKLVNAIKIAKRTRSIVWQNIVFALGVKAIVLVLGAGGIATIWEAVFADVGVTLIAVINAMRVMKTN